MATKTKKPTTTRLGFVIDESGSMQAAYETVPAGYNEFVATLQREAPDASQVYGSLAFFDSHGDEPKVRFKREQVALAEMPELAVGEYVPRGMTPLNDAVSAMIKHLAKAQRKGEQVMLVIMTDGQENASETHTRDLQRLVQAREADGWEFIYLGANVDSFKEARKLGMSGKRGSTYAFASSAGGTGQAMKRAASLGSTYTTSGARGMAAAAAATPDHIAEDPEEFKQQQEEFEKARKEFEDKQTSEVRAKASEAATGLLGGEEE